MPPGGTPSVDPMIDGVNEKVGQEEQGRCPHFAMAARRYTHGSVTLQKLVLGKPKGVPKWNRIFPQMQKADPKQRKSFHTFFGAILVWTVRLLLLLRRDQCCKGWNGRFSGCLAHCTGRCLMAHQRVHRWKEGCRRACTRQRKGTHASQSQGEGNDTNRTDLKWTIFVALVGRWMCSRWFGNTYKCQPPHIARCFSCLVQVWVWVGWGSNTGSDSGQQPVANRWRKDSGPPPEAPQERGGQPWGQGSIDRGQKVQLRPRART